MGGAILPIALNALSTRMKRKAKMVRKFSNAQYSLRRGLVVSFVVATALLVLSSAAFACTVFRGALQLSVTSGGTGTVTAVAKGSNESMVHCTDPQAGTQAELAGSSVAGTIDVTITPATCSSGSASTLKEDIYTVAWTSEWANDCMTVGGAGVQLGTISVDAGGYSLDASGNRGAVNFPIPAVATDQAGIGNEHAAVCVTSTTQTALDIQQGNKAPVLVI